MPNPDIAITSVVNNQDGKTFSLTLSGTPVGTPQFFIHRIPRFNDAITPLAVTGNNPYTVTVPAPVLWYVWVQDATGLAGPEAVWVTRSNSIDHDEVGMAVQQILLANKKGIEAQIKTWSPQITIKQIVYGLRDFAWDFPAIIIHDPDLEENYEYLPWGKSISYGVQITAATLHNEPQTLLPLMTRLGRAIQSILLLPYYETIILPSGFPLVYCQATTLRTEEIHLGDGLFIVYSQMQWRGSTLKTDTPLSTPYQVGYNPFSYPNP